MWGERGGLGNTLRRIKRLACIHSFSLHTSKLFRRLSCSHSTHTAMLGPVVFLLFAAAVCADVMPMTGFNLEEVKLNLLHTLNILLHIHIYVYADPDIDVQSTLYVKEETGKPMYKGLMMMMN